MTEDLTTYTEVDALNYLSKTSSRVTASAMGPYGDAYLYKDFGTDFFNAIDIYFTVYIDNATNSVGYIGFANNVNDVSQWTNYVCVALESGVIWLGGNYVGVANNTPYYLHIHRVAGSGTVTLYVYSDSGRTTLVGTVTTTITSSLKFRYFYPMANYDTETYGEVFYGYAENFLFSRAIGGQVRIIGMMM